MTAASTNSATVTHIPYRPNFTGGIQVDGVTGYLVKVAKKTIDFDDLGSGASDTVAFDAAIDDAIILTAWIEVNTAAAGEDDLAVIIGESGGDTNGLIEVFTLHGIAAGIADTSGTARGAQNLTYQDSYTPLVTFTATELDHVSAGNWTFCVAYIQLQLED